MSDIIQNMSDIFWKRRYPFGTDAAAQACAET